MKSLRYDVRYTVVAFNNTQNFDYAPDSAANSITFKNTDGTATFRVLVDQQVPLQPGDDVNHVPGESYTIGGNYGELVNGTRKFNVKFPDGGGSCLIIEKYYVNYREIC